MSKLGNKVPVEKEENMKILLIEDDMTVRVFLKTVIQKQGHEVVAFNNAEDALAAFKDDFFPFLIVDVGLPGMDGLEFCKHVRQLPYGVDTYILVETGHMDIYSVLEAGADDYLTKPIDLNLLKVRLTIAYQHVKNRLERKLIREHLRKSEQRLEKITASAQDAIIIIDDNGKAEFWNKAAERIFGYTEDEILGKDIHSLIVHPQYYKAYEKGFRHFQDTGQGILIGQIYEKIAIRKDGTEFPAELSLSATQVDGKWRAIGIIRDITRRKKAEEDLTLEKEHLEVLTESLHQLNINLLEKEDKLKEANDHLIQLNQQKNHLLGMAAHDLRNPISVVQMYSTFLLDSLREKLDNQQKEVLVVLENTSKFMLELLEDVLDISQIESGKLDLQIADYFYPEILQHNIHINKIFAEKKNMVIQLDVDPEIGIVKLDKNKIDQVLNNLLSNAIKYSHPGTTIKVTVYVDGDDILTKVIDQGQGIPEDELPHVFNAFAKTSVMATGGERSTGLGLAIVKKIILGHKGKIDVESIVGKGSTFWFTLPRG